MKKLTKQQAEDFVYGIENEGMSYWLLDYTDETYPGTELESLIVDARTSLEKLETKRKEIAKRFKLEPQ